MIKIEYNNIVKTYFVNLFYNKKVLNVLYKILLAYLIICWIGMGLFLVSRVVERRYFYPIKYKEIVIENADYYGLDKMLIFSVIKTESNFNKSAQSKKGAKGLMQITDKTAKYIADKLGVENYDIFDEQTNINFGCFYIKYLYNRFKDMQTALVAYNAGEGNVSLWLMDKTISDDGKTLNQIPFAESREYLNKIKQNFVKYKKLYGNILDKSKNIE